MTKTKKIKGGVRLSALYQGTREEAMVNFLGNSTYTFVSNSTISCMAVLANLNAGIDSNFRTCRSNNLNAHVRQLFVKLMLVDNANNKKWHYIHGRTIYNGIEIATLANFQAEIDTQREIYRTTFISKSSFLDSLCPSIVGSGIMLVPFILPGLTDNQQAQLNQIIDGVGGSIQLRYIAMEMMQGFMPANQVLPKLQNGNYNFATPRNMFLHYIIQYEFTRLNRMGFFHGDAHFGNVMINPDYPYFSNDPAFLGRAIILDFGRTRRVTQQEEALVNAGQIRNNITYVYPLEHFYAVEPINRILDLRGDMYTQFRQNRINYLNSLKPFFIANSQFQNADLNNIIELIIDYIQHTVPHLYFGGRDQKIENVFEFVSENNKMENNKMENNKMENNSKFEIEESIRMGDEFLERFKSHKCDWSEFLKPIKEQLETMDFEEVIGILRDEYDNKYSENVLLTIKPADKKNSGKINDSKRSDGKRNDSKRSDGKRNDSKRSDSKRSDGKINDSKRSDGKRSDGKRSDSKRKSKKNQKTQKNKK